MSEADPVSLVQAARLKVRAPGTKTMRQAQVLDDRFGADYVCRAARQVVAAWAMAVDGDDTALAAVAESRAAYWLMHPDRERWPVSPGPRVTRSRSGVLNLMGSRHGPGSISSLSAVGNSPIQLRSGIPTAIRPSPGC
jgi:hypothetical protein